MYNEHDSLTSWHKMTQDKLICGKNQSINQSVNQSEKFDLLVGCFVLRRINSFCDI